jgi:hypothetical protein
MFEATEANLVKAEKALAQMEALIPTGISFGGPTVYDEHLADFVSIVEALPKIAAGKWKLTP